MIKLNVIFHLIDMILLNYKSSLKQENGQTQMGLLRKSSCIFRHNYRLLCRLITALTLEPVIKRLVGVMVAFIEILLPTLRTDPGESLKAPSSSPPFSRDGVDGTALSTNSFTTFAQPVRKINAMSAITIRIMTYRQDWIFLKSRYWFSQNETQSDEILHS